MKIDIVVHGRFWAFNFASALIHRGHDVRVLTNYPRMVVEKFGVDRKLCVSNLWHGLSSRVVHHSNRLFRTNFLERQLHSSFGRWAAQGVREDCDVVYCFSGVSEEVLSRIKTLPRSPLGVLVRGSAHIRTQHDLLVSEEQRWGSPVEKPSDWMIAREEREYAAADRILILSEFARQSFIDQGTAPDKLVLSNLGVDTELFKPPSTLIDVRRQRILAGNPLRVLTVGSLSPRKGALDLFSVANNLRDSMRFRFVGDYDSVSTAHAARLAPNLELMRRVPEMRLPEIYSWADIFLFPTIEDGFAAVLSQAAAAGLPIICTKNCGGPDLLRAGASGWAVEKRAPDQIIELLRWCNSNRQQFADMLPTAETLRFTRDWGDTADDFARAVSAKPDPSPRAVEIVVHGRFFAFGLAQAMAQRGQQVRVLTNYPKLVAARFGVTREMAVPCVWHGVVSRILHRLSDVVNRPLFEPWVHESFGRWAATRVRQNVEAVVCFSGVAEEVFVHLAQTSRAQKILVRGSAHIREQFQLLDDEEARSGIPVEKPSDWMIKREEREYAIADKIVVLSTFALESFKRHGIPEHKLSLIGLGTDTSRFRPNEKTAADRRNRILSNPRLRVLMVGSLSPQKGAFDYIELVSRLASKVDFRFVGDVPKSVRELVGRVGAGIQIFGRVAEHDLPVEYAWADLFVFPTIQDGYAVVIAQALASGLPVICTTNCAGRDVVVEGRNGWVVPIRDIETLTNRVTKCDADRPMLAAMAVANATSTMQRDWQDVATDFEQFLVPRS